MAKWGELLACAVALGLAWAAGAPARAQDDLDAGVSPEVVSPEEVTPEEVTPEVVSPEVVSPSEELSPSEEAPVVPPLAIDGTVLRVTTQGAPTWIDLGCPGNSPTLSGEVVFVLCPPRRLVRVRGFAGGAPRIEARTLSSDHVRLERVEGAIVAVAADGQTQDVLTFRPPPPPTLPDPRLDEILRRAAALARRGRSEAALEIVERAAAQPRCPSLLWDGDTALSVRRGLRQLESPENRWGDWAPLGIGATVLGGLGVLGTTITLIAASLIGTSCTGFLGAGGCTYPRVDLDPFAASYVASGVVLVAGVVTILVAATTRGERESRFIQRRRELFERFPTNLPPTEVAPAFGMPDACPRGDAVWSPLTPRRSSPLGP